MRTQRLIDILVMPDLSRQDILTRLDRAHHSHTELLFVAPVLQRTANTYSQDASEFHLDWSPDLGVSVKNKSVRVVERLKSKGVYIAPIVSSGGMVMGISTAGARVLYGNLHAVPEDLWAVTTTAYGCPVASSHELSFAAHLQSLNRHFYKPIYPSPTYPFLPDFDLLDCAQGPTPVEIFGMLSVDAYQEQKALKRQFYGMHCIDWDITLQPTLDAWLEHSPLPSRRWTEDNPSK